MSGSEAKFQLQIGAIDKFSPEFRKFGAETDKTGQKLGKVTGRFAKLRSVIKRMGFAKLRGALKGVGAGLARVGTQARALGMRLMIAGAAVGAAIAGMYKLVRAYTDYGDASIKSAQKSGVSLQNFQEMAHAANLSGVSQEKLVASYGKLNKTIEGAAKGNKAQADTFKKLGITLTNAEGKIKPTNDLFLEIAESLSKMPEGAEKTALAMEVFGKSGAELMPMLNNGADGLKTLSKEANALGLVMSVEDARAAEAFNDDVNRLNTRIKGLAMTIGKAILPAMHDMVKFISSLIDENRELLKVKVTEWAEKLRAKLPKLKDAIKGVLDKSKSMASTIGKIVDKLGGFQKIAMMAAGVMAGPLVGSVTGLIGPMLKLGATMLTTPVGWIAIAVAGIGFLAHKFGILKPLLDGVKKMFGSFSEAMSGKFKGALSGITPYLDKVRDWVESIDWEGLGRTLADGVAAALERMIPAYESVLEQAKDVQWGKLFEQLKDLGDVILPIISVGMTIWAAEMKTILWVLNQIADKAGAIKDIGKFVLSVTPGGMLANFAFGEKPKEGEAAPQSNSGGLLPGAPEYGQGPGVLGQALTQAMPALGEGAPVVSRQESVTHNTLDIRVTAAPGAQAQTALTGQSDAISLNQSGNQLGMANGY
jgi:hypothetical protein